MDWEKVKLGLWGAAGGAVVVAVVGFSWGGWVTGSTARAMAQETAADAVVSSLAPICVEQFRQDSEKVRKLRELTEEDSWKRDKYVEKQNWATMPGRDRPESRVAARCAELIMKLDV